MEFLPNSHCSQCASTDYEDLYTGDQGYTACCNEPVCGRDNCTVDEDGWHVQGEPERYVGFNLRHPYSI